MGPPGAASLADSLIDQPMQADKPYGNGVLLWFEVDDFEGAIARVAEALPRRGARPGRPPQPGSCPGTKLDTR